MNGIRDFWIGVALTGVAGCVSPSAPRSASDPDLDARAEVAQAAYMRTGAEAAAPLYEAALAEARRRESAEAIRAFAFNLAVCRLELGDPRAAEAPLREAHAAARSGGFPMAEILALESGLDHARGNRSRAWALMEAARATNAGVGSRDREIALRVQGAEMAFAEGRWDAVHSALEKAEKAIRSGSHPAVLARLEAVRAQLADREDRPADAGAARERQAYRLAQAGQARDVPLAMEQAADAYARAGLHADSAVCGFRAARTWMAREMPERGRRRLAIAEAEAAAPDVPPALREEIRQYRERQEAKVHESLGPRVKMGYPVGESVGGSK